jgi:hypothetical protein
MQRSPYQRPSWGRNVVACYAGGESYLVPYRKLEVSYPGCGDLLPAFYWVSCFVRSPSKVGRACSCVYFKAIEATMQAGYEKTSRHRRLAHTALSCKEMVIHAM